MLNYSSSDYIVDALQMGFSDSFSNQQHSPIDKICRENLGQSIKRHAKFVLLDY